MRDGMRGGGGEAVEEGEVGKSGSGMERGWAEVVLWIGKLWTSELRAGVRGKLWVDWGRVDGEIEGYL